MTRHRHGLTARLTIVSALVCGLFLAISSSSHAISGPAGSVDAGAAQYAGVQGSQDEEQPGPTAQQPPEQNIPLGEETPSGDRAPESTVLPETTSPPPRVLAEESEEGGKLPFTGWLVLAVLMAGLVSLLLGVVLRHRTAVHPH